MFNDAIAHSRNASGVQQPLDEHLANVATLAKQFASQFNHSDAAGYLGQTHDLGKLKASWQERLLRLEAWTTAGENNDTKPQFDEMLHDHKMAAAALIYSTSKELALVIAGHHGGMTDFAAFKAEIESGRWEASRQEIAEKLQGYPEDITFRSFATFTQRKSVFFQLMMLYSALVDADSIDTSAHFDSRIVTPQFSSMMELHNQLLGASLPSRVSPEVQAMRTAVRESALAKVTSTKGFLALHAPTGSGKTISGGLLATGHAAFHGMKRVIYVAPYRTIIDQTADIYASLFGSENVLAHHSTADFWTVRDDVGRLQRQIAENWDVPVVVTTSEQFFESLFSARPGASRKLHNIVNSVIVVDEPQAIPTRLLTPAIAALKVLVQHFGCSVLFMSATVAILQHAKLLGESVAVNYVLNEYFKSPQRVSVDLDRFNGVYWSDIAAFMSQQKQVLSIANTKAGALRIYQGLPRASRTYLSTWLCPMHRKQVVASIKAKLSEGKECHVSSTQVIEAGVDLDFPDVLLREKAPLDSLLQAFGRCNRNGLGKGHCYVFSPMEGNALRDYEQAISVVNYLLYERRHDAFSLETLREYYRMLYAISNLDGQNIMHHVAELNYETVRRGNEETGEGRFRLIEEGQIHLVVSYGTTEQQNEILEAMQAIREKTAVGAVPPRWATRRLQSYVVSVYPSAFRKLSQAFPLALEDLYLNYYEWRGDYSERTGLGDVIDSLKGSDDEE